MQGFTEFHYTPLEVLAIIEGVQLRTGRQFTPEEIEGGVLEDILTEDDYDVLRVVSIAYLSPSNTLVSRSCCVSPSNAQIHVLNNYPLITPYFRRKISKRNVEKGYPMRPSIFLERSLDSLKPLKRNSKVSIAFSLLLALSYFLVSHVLNNPLFPSDLPPDARLDDLASLLQLDTKNIDTEKLGVDLIKQQQRINLKFSSNQSAVIPDDRAQVMLAGVSNAFRLAFERASFQTFRIFAFERAKRM